MLSVRPMTGVRDCARAPKLRGGSGDDGKLAKGRLHVRRIAAGHDASGHRPVKNMPCGCDCLLRSQNVVVVELADF
jgi:hypothetical protein